MNPFTRRSALRLAAAGITAACTAPAVSAATPKKILIVTRLEGKNLAIDQQIQQYLAERGYSVTLHSQYAPVEAAMGADLLILSSNVRSHDLLGAYRNLPVPLLSWESDLLDDLAMTGKRTDIDFGAEQKQRYLWLVNAPHPMAAGLPAGITKFYDKPLGMNWGKPGPGATVIATLYGQLDKAAIFSYEKGATMDYETLAPARRVMFCLDNETFPNLTDAGKKLFDAAVEWSMAIR